MARDGMARDGVAWDAVVLAGGTSRRLRADSTIPPATLGPGMDKTELSVGGRTLLERVLDGCSGASRIAVVGPVRPIRPSWGASDSSPPALLWCQESPPGAGPLAAVATGVRATGGHPGAAAGGGNAAAGAAPVIVVLGGDMPFVGGAVPHLLAALVHAAEVGRERNAVALAREGGGHHPLALAVRRTAVLAALTRLGDPAGRPLRLLLDELSIGTVPDAGDWAWDVDDGAGLRAALARITTVSP